MSRNYAQNNALLAGIRTAQGVMVDTADYDLQNPLEKLLKLLSNIQKGMMLYTDHQSMSSMVYFVI